MADDRMRLAAEVTDGFTGPLGKLQAALSGTGTRARQVSTDIKKDFDGVHGAVGKVTGALSNVSPVLTQFGIGMLGAVTSVTAVSAALRGFTGNTQALSMMSKETGTTIDRLRAFGELGERFGVSTQTMQGSVKSFATTMYDLRKRYSETYNSLQAMNLGSLVEDLISAPNMDEGIKRAMEGLGKIPNPEVRRRVSRMLFGTDDIAGIAGELGGEFEKVMSDIARRMGRTTQEQVDAAKRFERSLSELKASAEGVTREAIAPLVEQMNEFLRTLQNPEIMAAFKKDLEGVGTFFSTTKKEIEALIRAYERIRNVLGLNAGDRSVGADTLPTDALEKRLKDAQNEYKYNEVNPEARDDVVQRQKELTAEIRRLTEALERARQQGGATVQQQSYGGPFSGVAGLIHKAGYGMGSLPGYGGAVLPGNGVFGGPLPTMGGAYGGGSGSGSRSAAGVEPPTASDGGGKGASGAAVPALSGSARERAMQYYAGLRAGGLSANQANALMGHATQETGSSFSGSSWNAREGAGGMLQYRGNRLANLKAYAAKMGKPWTDPYVQGRFASAERTMDPYEAKRSKGFFNATDLETAVREAGKNVVRFGDSTGPYRARMARAFADGSAYDSLGAGKSGSASASAVGEPPSHVGAERIGLGGSAAIRGLKGVDPRLTGIVSEASRYLPEGYSAKIVSGLRPGDRRFHGRGMAMDIEILDPSGRKLGNYQDAAGFRAYERFAQTARKIQMERHPELAQDFRWGGYFGGGRGKYGALDSMHFDLGGRRVGMGGGSWEGGLTDAQRRFFPGIVSKGMGDVAAFKLPGRAGETAASASSPGPSGDRLGDRVMRRLYGDEAPFARGPMTEGARKGSLDITLNGFPAGARARASMDDLFKETNVTKSRPQMEMTKI